MHVPDRIVFRTCAKLIYTVTLASEKIKHLSQTVEDEELSNTLFGIYETLIKFREEEREAIREIEKKGKTEEKNKEEFFKPDIENKFVYPEEEDSERTNEGWL